MPYGLRVAPHALLYAAPIGRLARRPLGLGWRSSAGARRAHEGKAATEQEMSFAIRVHAYGGPEVLTWEEVTVPEPGPGQAKIRQHAVGLNFIDVYHRNGL